MSIAHGGVEPLLNPVSLLAASRPKTLVGANRPDDFGLQTTKQFVEFVGGVEIGFEFAGAELVAEFIEAAREKIERRREHFLIGQNDVAPRGVRAAGEAERIAEAGTSEHNRQTIFVKTVVEKRTKSDGGKLRKVRGEANCVIVLFGTKPKRARADFLENLKKCGDAGVARRMCGAGVSHRIGNQSVRIAAEQVGVGVCDPGNFLPRHRMTAKKKRRAGEMVGGRLQDAELRTACVGDEGVARRMARDVWKQIERRADGQCDVNNVGAAKRGSKVAVMCVVDNLESTGFAQSFQSIPTGDADVGGVFAKRER